MKYKWWIAGGLLVALLAVCAGIVLTAWLSLGQLQAAGVRLRFQMDTISAEADEEQRFGVSGPATLDVTNEHGKITVTSGPGSEMVIAMHKTGWGASRAEAEAALAALKVNITQTGNAVTVKRVEQPTVYIGTSREKSVDFTITVPAGTAVAARTGSGDVTLSGTTGGADLHTDYGAISVTSVDGSLRADTNSGKIAVRDVRAGATTLDLRSDYGAVTLERALAGEVKVYSSSGVISLSDVQAEGSVTLSGGYGEIKFEGGQAASLSIKTSSGRVELTRLAVRDALIAHSGYGDVTLAQVAARSYDLSTNSGKVTVNGASGALQAQSDYGNVEVTNGQQVRLDLRTSSGTITFAGSLGEGPHTLKTNYGNVRLSLPKDTTLTFDLKTDYGKIKSDFSLTVSGDLDEKHWRGAINGGGANLVAATNSGDISLEILNP